MERLRKKGHEVVAASPNSGVNTITGEGLAEALAGAEVVIDLANSPSFEDKAVLEFFETSGRNLLAAEKAAGVRHHVALSVVGTERLQGSGYFRGKMAQENLIKAGRDSLHDRAIDAVLRIHGRHRPVGRGRADRSPALRLYAAHRRRRRRPNVPGKSIRGVLVEYAPGGMIEIAHTHPNGRLHLCRRCWRGVSAARSMTAR